MARALFFWVIFMISVPFRVFGEFYSFRRSREFLGFCDSFGRSGEVGQNGAGDGLAFGRWDDIAGKLRTFGRWKRAEWKGNAATGSVGHMARKLTFGRWKEIVGNCLTFGRWDEYGRRTAACGGWMGSGVGRWDEYGELEWVAGDGWLDG